MIWEVEETTIGKFGDSWRHVLGRHASEAAAYKQLERLRAACDPYDVVVFDQWTTSGRAVPRKRYAVRGPFAVHEAAEEP